MSLSSNKEKSSGLLGVWLEVCEASQPNGRCIDLSKCMTAVVKW